MRCYYCSCQSGRKHIDTWNASTSQVLYVYDHTGIDYDSVKRCNTFCLACTLINVDYVVSAYEGLQKKFFRTLSGDVREESIPRVWQVNRCVPARFRLHRGETKYQRDTHHVLLSSRISDNMIIWAWSTAMMSEHNRQVSSKESVTR